MTPPRASITVLSIALSFFLSYIICLARGLPANYALLGGEASAALTCFGILLLIWAPWNRPKSSYRRKKSNKLQN